MKISGGTITPLHVWQQNGVIEGQIPLFNFLEYDYEPAMPSQLKSPILMIEKTEPTSKCSSL